MAQVTLAVSAFLSICAAAAMPSSVEMDLAADEEL
jgi:hypothetical protein